MSARFGRNQRRRAREAQAVQAAEIARLEAARAMDAGLLADMSRKNSALTNIMQDVRSMLPRNSVMLPPMPFGWPHLETSRPAVIPLSQQAAMWGNFSASAPIDFAMNVQRQVHAWVLNTRVEERDEAVHFVAEFGGHCLGYALTYQALDEMPRDYLIRQVSQAMASGFEAEFAKRNTSKRKRA